MRAGGHETLSKSTEICRFESFKSAKKTGWQLGLTNGMETSDHSRIPNRMGGCTNMMSSGMHTLMCVFTRIRSREPDLPEGSLSSQPLFCLELGSRCLAALQ
uniref:Uncharacterized protein n=1 Tax=Globodera rostochiensis TaxID=31243 RepID=A0A914H734_GLORO